MQCMSRNNGVQIRAQIPNTERCCSIQIKESYGIILTEWLPMLCLCFDIKDFYAIYEVASLPPIILLIRTGISGQGAIWKEQNGNLYTGSFYIDFLSAI